MVTYSTELASAENAERAEVLELHSIDRDSVIELRRGFFSDPPSLPSKYFYDQAGSVLFDEICELDEYYPTRTEASIMGASVDAMVDAIGPAGRLIEYGSGSSLKTRLLLEHVHADVTYVPVDISSDYLTEVAEGLRLEFPRRRIAPIAADFTRPFQLPSSGAGRARDVVYFPGSTIGNFRPSFAATLLSQMRNQVGTGGGLLIGFDLQKDSAVLEAAYDDRRGITALFNLNLLRHLNRVAGGDFDLDSYRHVALYNDRDHRIEMYLESCREQTVTLAGHTRTLSKSHRILTELSHKYTIDGFTEMAAASGWQREQIWTDANEYFAVGMFRS
ncbi:ABC transporter ATP-binding protein [Rhodopirellula islandica]|uniref:ABC transporter ATP-binding protein n=1 Tax=Rhodopirellula islandica TaxID=595434 RepID=A0A0J1BCD5_RHOIS|nr:L-histidine N(alpha)-methyltransferase [Rhodopirellula islandica]KLU04171.1 ABC transporter ATP-binding protein [Rhodopirellula islandica]